MLNTSTLTLISRRDLQQVLVTTQLTGIKRSWSIISTVHWMIEQLNTLWNVIKAFHRFLSHSSTKHLWIEVSEDFLYQLWSSVHTGTDVDTPHVTDWSTLADLFYFLKPAESFLLCVFDHFTVWLDKSKHVSSLQFHYGCSDKTLPSLLSFSHVPYAQR